MKILAKKVISKREKLFQTIVKRRNPVLPDGRVRSIKENCFGYFFR